MKTLVYIAGPFGPNNGMTMEENTFFAERVGNTPKLGYAPVCLIQAFYGEFMEMTESQQKSGGNAIHTRSNDGNNGSPNSELWVITDELGEMSEALEEYNVGV